MNIKRLNENRIEEAVKLADEVFRPGGGSMGKDYPCLFSKENAKNILCIEDKKKLVSIVGVYFKEIQIFNSRVKTALIGSVCTDENHRGKGYSTELMKEAERLSIKNKAPLMLISGDNSVYRKFGAVDAGVYFTHVVNPGTPSESKFRKAGALDIDFLLFLRSREPVRFSRTSENMKFLLELSRAMDRPADIFVSESAYMVVVNHNGMNNCVESAGCPNAVADLVHAFANENGPIMIHTTMIKCALNSMLSTDDSKRRRFPGTVKVLDKEMLLNQMKPYFDEALTPEALETFRKEIMPLDLSEFTKSFFGSTEKIEKFPSPRVFPIPLPDYGMDYV